MSAAEELIDAAGLSYLASPYSHDDPAVRHSRFKEAERVKVWLLRQRIYAISPIVACHELAYQHNLPFTAEFWGPWNLRLFFTCNRLLIICLTGWQDSKGVAQEIRLAKAMKMPIYHIVADNDLNPFDLSIVRDT